MGVSSRLTPRGPLSEHDRVDIDVATMINETAIAILRIKSLSLFARSARKAAQR